jgi:hypothetical protein
LHLHSIPTSRLSPGSQSIIGKQGFIFIIEPFASGITSTRFLFVVRNNGQIREE